MSVMLKKSLSLLLIILLIVASSALGGSVSAAETVTYSEAFGEQLSGLSLEIYNSLVDNYMHQRKIGSYTYKLNEPITFEAVIEDNTFVSNDAYRQVQNTISRAFQPAVGAFGHDCPQVFWISSISMNYSISFEYSNSGWIGKISEITYIQKEIYEGASQKVAQFDMAVEATAAQIKQTVGNGDRYATIQAIHDFVCEKAYYKLVAESQVHSAGPIFAGDGGVVCEGYAKSVKILCDELGIPCALISGTADSSLMENEPHMWNYILMDDGKWYLLDATWNDGDTVSYKYFLSGWNSNGYFKKISEEREESGYFTTAAYKEFVYPKLCDTAFKTADTHNWATYYTIDTKPTCTKTGVTSRHCLDSGCIARTDITTIEKVPHQGIATTEPATLSANGTKHIVCIVCGKETNSVIYRPTTIKLSTTSYTYNGAVKTPSVIVKDSTGEALTKNTDYTVTYASGRKNAGTYKVTVKFKGDYSGSKALSFKINPISYSKCSFKLSTTSYTYNGKTKTPSVTVKNANGTTLKKNTHYTVTYSTGRKNVGKYKVTIKMKGNYSGTKTLYFKINPVKTTVKSLTAGKKSLKVSITKKTSQVTGYQIYCSTSKSFSSNVTKKYITSYKTTSTTLKSLKAKKTYYVKVRTYKTVGGVKYYSGWSTYKYAKTK